MQKGFTPLLYLIIIGLILAGGIFYLWKNNMLVLPPKTISTPTTIPTNVPAKAQTPVFYQYAATVMGLKVTDPGSNPISAMNPLTKYSDLSAWKIFRNENTGYEIKYPGELTFSGGFFEGRNSTLFGPRIRAVDTQQWDIFNDKKITVKSQSEKTVNINGMKVKYAEFLEIQGNLIKNYWYVYQYPNGKEFTYLVYDFISQNAVDDDPCSQFTKPPSEKAPPGYPGNTICTDDITPKTVDDYKNYFKTEIEVFNKMAQTVKVFPKVQNPLPVTGY